MTLANLYYSIIIAYSFYSFWYSLDIYMLLDIYIYIYMLIVKILANVLNLSQVILLYDNMSYCALNAWPKELGFLISLFL